MEGVVEQVVWCVEQDTTVIPRDQTMGLTSVSSGVHDIIVLRVTLPSADEPSWTVVVKTGVLAVGSWQEPLYLVFAIVACVLQAVRSSRAAQTVEDLVQRTAQMEEQRNEINVNFQVADDSETRHDGTKPSQQHCRRLEASWNTVVGKLRVPVVMLTCRCEHRVGYTGARAWDCGGACRTTTDAVAQRQSWTGVQLEHPCPHWWAITVTSNLPPTKSGSRFGGDSCAVWNKDAGTHASVCERMSGCEETHRLNHQTRSRTRACSCC